MCCHLFGITSYHHLLFDHRILTLNLIFQKRLVVNPFFHLIFKISYKNHFYCEEATILSIFPQLTRWLSVAFHILVYPKYRVHQNLWRWWDYYFHFRFLDDHRIQMLINHQGPWSNLLTTCSIGLIRIHLLFPIRLLMIVHLVLNCCWLNSLRCQKFLA